MFVRGLCNGTCGFVLGFTCMCQCLCVSVSVCVAGLCSCLCLCLCLCLWLCQCVCVAGLLRIVVLHICVRVCVCVWQEREVRLGRAHPEYPGVFRQHKGWTIKVPLSGSRGLLRTGSCSVYMHTHTCTHMHAHAHTCTHMHTHAHGSSPSKAWGCVQSACTHIQAPSLSKAQSTPSPIEWGMFWRGSAL